MVRALHISRTDLRVFAITLGVFVVLPLLCWLVLYYTQSASGFTSDSMFYLFVAVAPWVLIPGFVFRQPLFDPVEIGYSPHGALGAFAVVVFWTVFSLIISLAVRYFMRVAQRGRTI